MDKRILITGGAGFIGSHLADELLNNGYQVRVLDNLSPQVHGQDQKRPDYLHKDVELQVGDVRDPEAVDRALKNIDAVFHFAAAVGVGQSMYEIRNYTDVNNIGTAVLLEGLMKNPVKKLVVASSMSLYGEGYYKTEEGEITEVEARSIEQLKQGDWEIYRKGKPLTPQPTDEKKSPDLSSVYALSKYDQEKLCLIFGKTYQVPVSALRFFNVYGTRQALSNPYTGVLAIFASRLMNNNSPLIYEDGNQMRDFVSVYDVARACRLTLENPASGGEVFNIGSGNRYTVKQIAGELAKVMGKNISPTITKKYRAGDIRHCFSDVSKAKEILGFTPQIAFSKGLAELSEWLQTQVAVDTFDKASSELEKRGLAV